MSVIWFIIASILATLSIILSIIAILTDRDRPHNNNTYQRRH